MRITYVSVCLTRLFFHAYAIVIPKAFNSKL